MSISKCQAVPQALQLFKQGDQQAAIAIVNKKIEEQPYLSGPWMLRAMIRHAQAEWSAALPDAEMAMTLAPLPLSGQLVLADCYAHTGHPELALVGYQHLLTIGPLPSDLYAGLCAGLRSCGRNDLALAACRAAVDTDPENHAAYFGMAHCMSALGYSATYIASVLRTAVRLEPSNQTYRTSLAIQLVRGGEPTSAYSELSRVAAAHLESIDCPCSAQKLLDLSLWAGDDKRSSALETVVKRLSADNHDRNKAIDDD